jgi:hypothetical protein
MQRLGREGLKLQVGPLHIAVKEHQARQIHRPLAAKHLVLFELEVHAQPLHNLRIGVAFNLQPHRVALAAVVQLHADGFQQRPRFFLFEVEVRVARHAERRRCQHLVAAIHAAKVLRDQVLQQQVVVVAMAEGRRTKRGKARGTVTTPSTCGPELRRLARSSSARHSALFSTRGNGCAGSIEIGVSSGSTSR